MKWHNPELLSLSIIDWQLFCTFTFKQNELSERVRLAMLFAVLRTLAHNSGLHFKKLLWVVRTERGEQFGRLHYHALIAGLPSHWKNWATANSLEKLWRKIGGGHPRVSVFNPSLDGVDYILKRGDELARSLSARRGGDNHELCKFGGSCDLTLSESVCAHLFQRQLQGRWGRGTSEKQGWRLLGETGRPDTEPSGEGSLARTGQRTEDSGLNLPLPIVG